MAKVLVACLMAEENLYPRDGLSGSRIRMFADLYRAGEPVPPIEAIDLGDGTYLIPDGVTRYFGAREAGLNELEVVLVAPEPGEEIPDFAYRRALETATRSALPLTQSERKRAVARLIKTRPDLSRRAVARLVGVAHSTVDRWADGVAESASGSTTTVAVVGPNADEVALKLVRYLERLSDSRGLLDLFAPKRMGAHVAQAFYDCYGDHALAEARTMAAWMSRAVAVLSGGGT